MFLYTSEMYSTPGEKAIDQPKTDGITYSNPLQPKRFIENVVLFSAGADTKPPSLRPIKNRIPHSKLHGIAFRLQFLGVPS